MKATPSWQTRQQIQKAERKRLVSRQALALFLEQGIENTTMNAVAEHSGIGVASLYRYFTSKPELVIAAASLFWREDIQAIYRSHEQTADQHPDGLSRVVHLLGIYLELYDDRKQFFSFLEQFDRFILGHEIPPSMLEEYDQSLAGIRSLFEDALAVGMEDGSIRAGIDVQRFAATIAVALIAFAQKLVSRGNITPSDHLVDARRELELFVDMIRHYLSPGEASRRS